MSRLKRNHKATTADSSAGRRVRRMAAQVKPAAAQMKPFAQRAGAATKRGVHTTRAWAAPQVERTGQVLQDSVAPKVSAWLSAAARRLEPAKPQPSRWRKVAGISALAAAAAGAAAALVNSRKKPDSAAPAAATDAASTAPGTAESDGQATPSTGADADGQVRTS